MSQTERLNSLLRFVGLIRSVVKRQAGLSPADVEDFTQSTFLALATSLNNYDSMHSLARFVCVVAQRVLIDEYRRTKAAKRDAETESVEHHDGNEEGTRMVQSELESPDQQMEKAQLVSNLRGALGGLDPRCRELIHLRYYDELAFGEIAAIVGLTENTLTVQTRRCLEKLAVYRSETKTSVKIVYTNILDIRTLFSSVRRARSSAEADVEGHWACINARTCGRFQKP
jgi:RNA polymerase sigma-70 factor (ECF subfamily)